MEFKNILLTLYDEIHDSFSINEMNVFIKGINVILSYNLIHFSGHSKNFNVSRKICYLLDIIQLFMIYFLFFIIFKFNSFPL